MKLAKRIKKQRIRRTFRVRNRARATGNPRLSVFRSNKHIYAQIIDDVSGKTLAAAGTNEKSFGKTGGNRAAATQIGEEIARRAVAAGVTAVTFDRGRYQYHGRVAALAEAARKAGLKF